MDCKYIFDPEGDTMLRLKKADDPYTVLGCDYLPRRREILWPLIRPQLGVYRESWEASRDIEPSEHDEVDYVENEEEILMRVSSKHLSLASPYWKAALSEKWLGLRQPGEIMLLEVQEFDIDAMATLMNVIHGHGHEVTRTVSIDELVRLTILMDYFQCTEVCSPYTDIWMEHIIRGTEKKHLLLCDNLQALWVFRVLGHPYGTAFFKEKSVRSMSQRPIPPFLPGTRELIAEIDYLRVVATRRVVNKLLKAVWEIGACDSCFENPWEKFCKLLWSFKIYDAKKDRVLFNCSLNTIESVALNFKVLPCTCPRPEKVRDSIARVLKRELTEI